MPTASQGQGILARLPAPAFWIVTVCASLIAGALLFLILGVLAALLNPPDGVIFRAALSGFLAGFIGLIVLLRRRRRRGQEPPLSVATADSPPGCEAKRREPFFGGPRATSSTASPGGPAPVFADVGPEPKQSPSLAKFKPKEIIVFAVVAGIAVTFFFSGGSTGGSTGGVDGILGLLGSAVCNILEVIGARSFMPEACPYNPVKAAHHLIAVFGAILLIEEMLRRIGGSAEGNKPPQA